MDNNNYQPQYQQSNPIPPHLQQEINAAFGKALAALIMAGLSLPISSLIGSIMGGNVFKSVLDLYNNCSIQGVRVPNKLRTAKILAIIGKWLGFANVITYIVLIAFYFCYFVLIFGVFAATGF